MHFFPDVIMEGNNNAFYYLRKFIQVTLYVLGVDVQPVRTHDYLFEPPLVVEPALVIDFPDVTGVKPSVDNLYARVSAGSHVFGDDRIAPDEDFPAWSDLDLLTLNRFADRSSADVERVIDGHHGTGLGEPVALHQQQSDLTPKDFQPLVELRPPHDQRPEFVAQ